jgi:hypothetical protein
MKMSEQIGELAAALAKAQAVMGAAVKDSTNPHYKSKYADLSSVIDACRDPLSSNGLSISQFPCNNEQGTPGVNTILMHSSGQYISQPFYGRPSKDDPQGLGGLITYFRRYGTASVAGVTQEDDDGNAASGKTGQGKDDKPDLSNVKLDAKPNNPPPKKINGDNLSPGELSYLKAECDKNFVTPEERNILWQRLQGKTLNMVTTEIIALLKERGKNNG